MPRLLMASAMCRMVGEVENTRAERLRVSRMEKMVRNDSPWGQCTLADLSYCNRTATRLVQASMQ